MRTKILVLVIIIVAVLIVWGTGQEPVTAISLILGAGLAGAKVSRVLISGSSSILSPESESGQPAAGS